MPPTTHRTTCPICRRRIRQAANRPVMLPHVDKTGHCCPYSGKEIGPSHDNDDPNEE